MDQRKIKELQEMAMDIRRDVIRTARDCDEGVHVGGSLSMAEILAVLFFHVMRLDLKNPNWPDRDRFILSKGHGNIGLSAAMARRGFFPLEELKRFDLMHAPLSMHIDKHRMPGVEISSGSLGHGLPVAVGLALAGRLDKAPWKVYVVIGDGEMMEGSMWEAMMSAAHYKLDNLTAVIDRNRFCLDGATEKIMSLEPFVDKMRAFNWRVLEIDGHDVRAVVEAFESEDPSDKRPKLIVANTTKGKGVSFLENTAKAHFAHMTPAEAESALAELEVMAAGLKE